jgi:uncharacterized protein (DUF3820 family)
LVVFVVSFGKVVKEMSEESLWEIPFGKHKGPIEDAPTSYLKWLIEQDWFCEKHILGEQQINAELNFRERWGDNGRS